MRLDLLIQAKNNNPCFVAVEGIDGSGKTSLAESLVSALISADYNAKLICRTTPSKFPSATERLREIGDFLWNYPSNLDIEELGDRHLISLMASWFYLFENCVIRPELASGKIVVVEPWINKYLARFLVKKQSWVLNLFADLPVPDITILLDVEPEIAGMRKSAYRNTETNSRGSTSLVQFVDFQHEVRLKLLNLSSDKWLVIDAKHELKKNVDAILQQLTNCLEYQTLAKEP
ncbi:thymidylate kinase [Duganella sp. BJB1802]|uniref:dTMP kinase n=1 Tax=Duganella sp. BJB1802 TaxID=2744575 RepID=UPI0015937140|nr:dTMP kinase [Duganella sp. BJB1802]NVD73480.1 thymidylate kinase [Duganella sp. BJB1802]